MPKFIALFILVFLFVCSIILAHYLFERLFRKDIEELRVKISEEQKAYKK